MFCALYVSAVGFAFIRTFLLGARRTGSSLHHTFTQLTLAHMMKCRFCGSTNVHRSRRKGVNEGLFLRLVLAAPFRCSDCQARFVAFASAVDHRRERHTNLTSYFGLGADAAYKLERWILVATVGAILLAVALIILRSTA